MNTATVNLLWPLFRGFLRKDKSTDSAEFYASLYSSEIDISVELERVIVHYVDGGCQMADFNALAAQAVRGYIFSESRPEAHLLLVGYLLSKDVIAADEACTLVQLDHSRFHLLDRTAIDLVRLAETVAEDEKMGMGAVASDGFFKENLMDYCSGLGFFYDNGAKSN